MTHCAVNLGVIEQVPLGEGRTFAVHDKQVAIFRERGGRVYATDAACPHAGGPLADGLLGGGQVLCPLHEYRFDLATGRSINAQCKINIYPVRVLNGEIHVELVSQSLPEPQSAVELSPQ